MSIPRVIPSRVQPRREFLGQIAASAIVLAGGPHAAAVGQTPSAALDSEGHRASSVRPTPGSSGWDDSWVGRLTAKHKAVFDSPQIEDGFVLGNAVGYIAGMRDALSAGERDVQAVIVLRHIAIVMAFNDAMWAKYEIGKDKQIRDDASGDWARRNLYLTGHGGGEAMQESDRPAPTLSWLASHGHVLLGCDLATSNYARTIARRAGGDQRAMYEELKANLVPGLILQPTGVYAALRAQEAGCGYIRAT